MPASGQKYLYERLTPQDFQLLVNAVMPLAFKGYQPLALGQADGGRDGVAVVDDKTLVFQVKWSGTGRHKDPVSWLAGVVRGEESNLNRLAKEGARRYVLVTNVPSTGKPGTGTFDRLNGLLEEYAKKYGFEAMTCVWREGLDGFLDSTPAEVKWVYADMLAGWDLIRYLVAEQFGASSDRGLRDLVRKVAGTQWDDDELVKFSQVDVDRERVADLFVDITGDKGQGDPRARRARAGEVNAEPVRRAGPSGGVRSGRAEVCGVADPRSSPVPTAGRFERVRPLAPRLRCLRICHRRLVRGGPGKRPAPDEASQG